MDYEVGQKCVVSNAGAIIAKKEYNFYTGVVTSIEERFIYVSINNESPVKFTDFGRSFDVKYPEYCIYDTLEEAQNALKDRLCTIMYRTLENLVEKEKMDTLSLQDVVDIFNHFKKVFDIEFLN